MYRYLYLAFALSLLYFTNSMGAGGVAWWVQKRPEPVGATDPEGASTVPSSLPEVGRGTGREAMDPALGSLATR